MQHETELWLTMAKEDLGVAKHLEEKYYPKPLEIICYHAQQAAEKAVKALIVERGAQGGLPKKHNLSFLLGQIKNEMEIEEKYYDYADVLTPYAIAARYPNELFLEERHAKEAIKFASEMVAWIERCVNLNISH